MNAEDRDQLTDLAAESTRWWALNAVSQGANGALVRKMYFRVHEVICYQMGLIEINTTLERIMREWGMGGDVSRPILGGMDTFLLNKLREDGYNDLFLSYVVWISLSDGISMPVRLTYGVVSGNAASMGDLKVSEWGLWYDDIDWCDLGKFFSILE